MQIRLTVLAPYAGHGAGRTCDVLVTAPAGTALAAVASGLAAAVTGPDTSASGTTVLYAGGERLDTRRCVLGEPPLVDGAVLSLQLPGPDDRLGEAASARLHVVAGPDAGGVHLLHGGAIRIGRSVDADVPLDDPDVSRAHCTVTVGENGRVTVADLGSTNGTTLDGVPVGDRPVRLRPGALLRLGESALRLTGPGDALGGTDTVATAPDGEGHLRVAHGTDGRAGTDDRAGADGPATGHRAAPAAGSGTVPGRPADATTRDTTHGGARGVAFGAATGETPPYEERYADDRHADDRYPAPYGAGHADRSPGHARAGDPADGHDDGGEAHSRTRQTRREAPPAASGRTGGKRGLGAWARRLAV
ncbi:FHA domain-containing protein, partial [Streptomyces wedmorensis]